VAPATGPAAPVAAVIGPVDGQRTSTATSTAGGAGVSPALLASAVILGALAGLAVVQLVMRRRRA
jgi:hypothetical protein